MRATPSRADQSPRALATEAEPPRRGLQGAILRRPRLAGALLGLFALAAVVVSTLAVNGLPFVKKHVLEVTLPAEAPLLKAGDEVRIAGKRAGTVAAVEPRDGRAVARLELSEPPGELRRARVRLRGFAGAVYVELTRGEAGATAAVNLPNVVADFDQASRDALAATLRGAGGGLAGRGESLNATLAAAPDALTDLTPLIRAMRPAATLIDPARTVAQAVTPGLGDLVTATAGAMQPVAEESAALGATINGLPAVEARAQDVLPQADPLLADAGAAARELEPAVDALARLLPDVRALERDSETLDEATRLLDAVRPVLAEARPVVVGAARWPAATLRPIARPTGDLSRHLVPYRFELIDAPAGFERWGGFRYDEGQGRGAKAVRFSMVFTCGTNRDPYPEPGEALTQRERC